MLQIIQTRVNEEFTIALDSFGSSGYVWIPQHNFAAIRFVCEKAHPVQEDRIGGGGKRDFTFKALAPGEFTIKFILKRPWRDKSEGEVSYLIRIS